MTRITTTILVFLVLMNGVTAVMAGSGLSDDLGVTIDPGGDSAVNESVSEAQSGFSPGGGGLSTLFGLFTSAMGFLQSLVTSVFAAPQMFINLGFPSWIVGPVFTPMYVVAALEFVYVATGRDLV